MKSSQIYAHADDIAIAIIARNLDSLKDMYALIEAEAIKLVLW